MAATGYEKDIDLPGPRPRTNGLLIGPNGAARQIPASSLTSAGVSRLTAGVTWLPWGEISLTSDQVGCDVDYTKAARPLPPVMFQPAFLVYDALTCHKLSGMVNELWSRLETNFAVGLSAAFATQLETGGQGGLGLIGANNYDTAGTDYVPEIVTSGAGSVQLGIALLEQYLADVVLDSVGVIHLTPGLYTIAGAFGMFDPATSRTPTGHLVVGDAGHTGQATPVGGSAPGSGNAWIYATTDVWWATRMQPKLEDAETGEGYELLRKNVDRPLMELYGLLAFDPNVIGAALVSYADSVP